MIVCIGNVLTDEDLKLISSQLESANFVDGKVTAGWHARLVKHNTQLPKDAPVLKEVRSHITAAIQRHPVFQMAARPKRIHPMLISRYEAGMAYGTHTDDALMRSQNQVMRSDVSFTLFLNSPADYEGGRIGHRQYPRRAGLQTPRWVHDCVSFVDAASRGNGDGGAAVGGGQLGAKLGARPQRSRDFV